MSPAWFCSPGDADESPARWPPLLRLPADSSTVCQGRGLLNIILPGSERIYDPAPLDSLAPRPEVFLNTGALTVPYPATTSKSMLRRTYALLTYNFKAWNMTTTNHGDSVRRCAMNFIVSSPQLTTKPCRSSRIMLTQKHERA